MLPALARLLRVLALLITLQILAACEEQERQQWGPVVLAAASLQESLREVASQWTAAGHASPVLSFAATSALARQVQGGAPADVFISADEEWMDTLAEGGLLRESSRRDVVGNRLVLIRRAGQPQRRLSDLGEGRLALADPAAVPAGRYARAALESLGTWQSVAAKVVPAENVRAAMALVERGEAALGVVYATDALASDSVEVIETLPAASHPPIRYPAAVIASSTHGEADGFAAFLASPQAQQMFKRHGFGPVR